MRIAARSLAPMCALVLVAVPALAAPPTVNFLTPSRYVAAAGDTLNIHFDAGAACDAQPTAWPSGQIEWLLYRGGPTTENRHDSRPDRPENNFVPVPIEHPGVTVIGVDRRAVVQDVTGGEFRTFAEFNLGDAAMVEKAKSLADGAKLRVRHIQSAKTLVRANADGRFVPSAVGTRKTGQKAEMRPLFDPTAAAVGSDLALLVYVEGGKLTGAKVQATNVTTGQTTAFITDAVGSGHFRVSDPGVWRVEFHHAEPLTDEAAADWVLYSGTLTFEVGTKGAGQ